MTYRDGTRTILFPGEVAKKLKCSLRVVRLWADRGVLPCFYTLGGHRRFYLDDIEKAIQENQSKWGER